MRLTRIVVAFAVVAFGVAGVGHAAIVLQPDGVDGIDTYISNQGDKDEDNFGDDTKFRTPDIELRKPSISKCLISLAGKISETLFQEILSPIAGSQWFMNQLFAFMLHNQDKWDG